MIPNQQNIENAIEANRLSKFHKLHQSKVKAYHALFLRWQISKNAIQKNAFANRLRAMKAEILKMQDDYEKQLQST